MLSSWEKHLSIFEWLKFFCHLFCKVSNSTDWLQIQYEIGIWCEVVPYEFWSSFFSRLLRNHHKCDGIRMNMWDSIENRVLHQKQKFNENLLFSCILMRVSWFRHRICEVASLVYLDFGFENNWRWPGSTYYISVKKGKSQVPFLPFFLSGVVACGDECFRVKGFHRRAVKSVSFENDANCVRCLCEIGLLFFPCLSFSILLQFLVKWP